MAVVVKMRTGMEQAVALVVEVAMVALVMLELLVKATLVELTFIMAAVTMAVAEVVEPLRLESRV